MVSTLKITSVIQTLIIAVGLAITSVISTPEVSAQGGTCQVGARVQVEMIDNAVGTITEIGTEVPHVGWYRVVFDWNIRGGNPKGEWYSPKNREIRIAGAGTKCGPAGSEDNAQPQNNTGRTTTAANAAADGECPMNEPPGKVTKTSAPSAQLFKRVIYEGMAAKVGGASISAPKKIRLDVSRIRYGQSL